MKTEFDLSKHRFYELKHFCLQYNEWKALYSEADGWSGKGDTTSRDGIKRADICRYVELIEQCANETGGTVLRFVTEPGITVPVEEIYFYKKFFWILSRKR